MTPSLLSLATLSDGTSVSVIVAGVAVHLSDVILSAKAIGMQRSYVVRITSSIAEASMGLTVQTRPLSYWSLPNQLPGGTDYLPGLNQWSWHVYKYGSVNDSSNWSASLSTGVLTRVARMFNITYQVVGTSQPTVQVQISANKLIGTHPPSVGFLLDNPGQPGGSLPANDSDFSSLAAPLQPTLIRLSQDTAAPATWNNSSGTPSFGFHSFGPIVNFSRSLQAQIYVSLPAGTWGDGNDLPAGIPLNRSVLVTFGPDVGYFPTVAAYTTYVRTFVNQTVAHGWSIRYWNIGNEVPVKNNLTVAAAYTQLFNAAASAILAVDPSSVVGSDVMLAAPAFSYIEANARHVGYLSFHFYVGQGTCMNQGTYCVPNDTAAAPRDPTFWATNHSLGGSHFVAPALAQQLWHNATGSWIPVFDSESNLNKAWKNGTDPRQQTLFGAAWVGSTLIDGAAQNLSEFTYFSFGSPPTTPSTPSGPYGGWGFGLTNEGTNDADLRYAPYWALELWSQLLRPDSNGVVTSTSNATLVRAYAARNATGISVALVNRAAVPIRFVVNVSGTPVVPVTEQTLDQGSYVEVFNNRTQTEQLLQSGVNVSKPGTNPVSVRINGYGIAVVRFAFTNSSGAAVAPPRGSLSDRPSESGPAARPAVPHFPEKFLGSTGALGGTLTPILPGRIVGRSESRAGPGRDVKHYKREKIEIGEVSHER